MLLSFPDSPWHDLVSLVLLYNLSLLIVSVWSILRSCHCNSAGAEPGRTEGPGSKRENHRSMPLFNFSNTCSDDRWYLLNGNKVIEARKRLEEQWPPWLRINDQIRSDQSQATSYCTVKHFFDTGTTGSAFTLILELPEVLLLWYWKYRMDFYFDTSTTGSAFTVKLEIQELLSLWNCNYI